MPDGGASLGRAYGPAPRFAILTVCNPAFPTERQFQTAMHKYAKRENHTLVLRKRPPDPRRPPAYAKVSMALDALNSPVDWVWWVDCDTLILDKTRPLRNVLSEALAEAATVTIGQPELVLSYEVYAHSERLKGSPWRHPINTGSFFLRNGPWASQFLRDWDVACRRKRWQLWDQVDRQTPTHSVTHAP
jgi:hypothetical protein